MGGGINENLLGIELAKRVVEITGCRYQIGNGANPHTTVPLRKIFFKDHCVKMKQYYLLNPDIEEFKVAKISKRHIPSLKNQTKYTFERLKSIEEVRKVFEIEKVNQIPYKDSFYFNKRYFNHPYYSYFVYGIRDEFLKTHAIFVAREVEIFNTKILRIVDYIGSHAPLADLGDNFINLVRNNYEYIDFVEYGIDSALIESAGFVLRKENDENIIPNYFEPFECSNVDIWCHYKKEGTLFFKADGDQDRPNIVRNLAKV